MIRVKPQDLLFNKHPHPEQLIGYYYDCSDHPNDPSATCDYCHAALELNKQHNMALHENMKYLMTLNLLQDIVDAEWFAHYADGEFIADTRTKIEEIRDYGKPKKV